LLYFILKAQRRVASNSLDEVDQVDVLLDSSYQTNASIWEHHSRVLRYQYQDFGGSFDIIVASPSQRSEHRRKEQFDLWGKSIANHRPAQFNLWNNKQ